MISTKNICIFGDSIAYGEWSREGGWGDRLQLELQRKTLDSKFQSYYFTYNLGIPGNTSEDVRKRFDTETKAREPHIILFAVGINDASAKDQRETPRVSQERFRENMEILFSAAQKEAPMVLCVGLSRVDETLTTPFETTYFVNKQIEEYDGMLCELSKAHHIPYLDISRILLPRDLADGLHPNDQGHEKLKSAVYNFLLPFA